MASPPTSSVSRRHMLIVTFTTLGGAGLLAACGGSAIATSTTAQASSSQVTRAAVTTRATSTVASVVTSTLRSAATTSIVATSSTAAAATSAPAAAKTTLVFEWPQYTQEKTDYGNYIMNTYMKLHPNITIQPMFNTNPTEKLTATVAGGSPPDVGWFGAGWAALLDAFLPLDSFVSQNKINPQNYFTKLWQSCHWLNKQYVMPNGFTVTLTYYNKDLLKNKSIANPTDSWIWGDLINAGDKVLNTAANVYGTALDMGSYWAELLYGGPMWTADGSKATIDNPVAIDLLQLYSDLDTRYKLVPPATLVKADGGNTQHSWLKGHVTFFAGGSWNLAPSRAAPFDWDIVPLPVRSVSGKNYQATGMWTEEFFIEKDTKHQPEAWQFLQWITGPELTSWAAQNGHIVPGRTDIANSPTFLKAYPKPANIQAFFKAADLAVPVLVHPEASKLSTALGKGVGLFLANPPKASATEALAEANKQMQIILDAYKNGQR